jgi:hypothetical protein
MGVRITFTVPLRLESLNGFLEVHDFARCQYQVQQPQAGNGPANKSASRNRDELRPMKALSQKYEQMIAVPVVNPGDDSEENAYLNTD